ncbi:Spy/CpxP family protein refolding chaperone [Dyella sp.]|uniref:Spy/CpxP family protein refolding chaperone n=1 Tax=Dyella sp. TaxID=1869338 RepID=UPI002FD8CACE
MRKSITLSLILSAVLGVSSLAFAQGGLGFGPGPHGHHGGAEMAFRGLNLTDAQKTQIKTIMQQSFASLKSQGQAVRQQREAFEALSPNASNYQSAAASLAQAEANFTSARITARAAVTAQIYNTVLTSAQQSQYASNKAAFQARKAQWQQFKATHPLPSKAGSAQ